MNIRKTLALMMVALFVFSATAFAAGTLDVCVKCGKDSIGHVPLPTAAQTTCNEFDFDGWARDDFGLSGDVYGNTRTGMTLPETDVTGNPGILQWPNLPTQAWNYCNGNNYDQRLVFQICNCTSVARFNTVDAKISIRMTVLTPGVYWAAPNMTAVNPLELLNDLTVNEPSPSGGITAATPQPSVDPTYGNSATTLLPEIRFEPYTSKDAACKPADPNLTRTFGGVRYWYLDGSGVRQVASPVAGNASCTLTAAQRATIIESYNKQSGVPASWDGYLIRPSDKNLQVSAWVIDVPPMRLDNTIAKSGDSIKIRVEMLDPGSAGICQACLPICSCDFEVGIIGCSSGGSCAFFPYVVTQATPWVSGIAISNIDSRPITSPSLTFTLTDSKGTVCKATVPFADKAGAWMLDDPKLAFSPKPAPGAAWLKVTGNFNLDGFQFMTDGNIGAGIPPRLTCPQ